MEGPGFYLGPQLLSKWHMCFFSQPLSSCLSWHHPDPCQGSACWATVSSTGLAPTLESHLSQGYALPGPSHMVTELGRGMKLGIFSQQACALSDRQCLLQSWPLGHQGFVGPASQFNCAPLGITQTRMWTPMWNWHHEGINGKIINGSSDSRSGLRVLKVGKEQKGSLIINRIPKFKVRSESYIGGRTS